MTGLAYLATVTDAATLLDLKVYQTHVEQLAAIIDKLSQFPGDVITKLDALQLLAGPNAGIGGSIEELEMLQAVFPDWNGSVRYRLTATTLQWCWSAKHTGRYATITVPFPTVLPLTFTVQRFCDMDNLDNHSDQCPQLEENDSDDYDSDCNCEGWIEQTVTLTVADWNDKTAATITDWLSRAVIEPVEEMTL